MDVTTHRGLDINNVSILIFVRKGRYVNYTFSTNYNIAYMIFLDVMCVTFKKAFSGFKRTIQLWHQR